MFSNCSSLTQAPALPATTLAEECYAHMFYNCTSLTQAPVLPAETLADNCYEFMFEGCTKLNNVNVNFIEWGDAFINYTTNWLNGVASKGTFTCPVDLPNPADLEDCPGYIPEGWTIIRK